MTIDLKDSLGLIQVTTDNKVKPLSVENKTSSSSSDSVVVLTEVVLTEVVLTQ